MIRKMIFFTLCMLNVPALFCQDMVDIYGYLESQIMGAKINDSFNQVQSNKLRVDFRADISDNITFAANYDYITYHGKTTWNVLNYLSQDITSQVPEEMRPYYVIPFSDRDFLDNAYMKIALKHLDITAGKQQISLGTGYVWNPIDVFNIKDVLDPTYEQPGHNALRVDVPIGLKYSMTALYAPEATWNQSSKLLQFKGRVGHFDYTITGIETEWIFHDYTRFVPEQQSFLAQPEKRQIIGLSTAGELLGLGVWAESAWNGMARSEDFYALVIGANYTFDFQTFVMLEFYRNTLAKSNFQNYTINDWMRLFAAEQKAIARDQIYILVQHPVGDFIHIGLSNIYSISDQSNVVVPTLNYSFAQNMDITAYLNFNIGKEGTAYSDMQGSGGLLRARVYF